MQAARAPVVPGVPGSPWVRRLPAAGIGLALADAAYLAGMALADPAQAGWLLAMIPALFLAGKEAAIPLGISFGVEPLHAALHMILADTAATLLFYPLVHLTMDSLEDRGGFLGRRAPFVGRMLRSAVRRAERRRRIVDRYGTAGLYLFSIIPFAFNGPPIVAAMGRLAGLRAHQVVPVLVAAIVTTSAAWATFYEVFFGVVSKSNRWIPLAVSLTVMAVMLGLGVVGALLDRSEDDPPPAPPAPPA